MQPAKAMMLTKRRMDRGLDRMLKTLIGVLPAIPYVMRRRRGPPVAAWVLGGLGIALAGGVAAVMLLSPRTRSRTVNAARTVYARVNERVRPSDLANGLVERIEESAPGS
jgi:hypothetical protein